MAISERVAAENAAWEDNQRRMLLAGFPWRPQPDAGRWSLYDARGACLARFNLDNGFASGLASAAPELLDACNGLIGLTQLLLARDDLPAEVREVLQTNHRVVDAKAISESALGGRRHKP